MTFLSAIISISSLQELNKKKKEETTNNEKKEKGKLNNNINVN